MSWRRCLRFLENIRKHKEDEFRERDALKFSTSQVKPNFPYAQSMETSINSSLSSTQFPPAQPISPPLGVLAIIPDLKFILRKITTEFGVPNFNELIKLYKYCLEHIKQTNNSVEK